MTSHLPTFCPSQTSSVDSVRPASRSACITVALGPASCLPTRRQSDVPEGFHVFAAMTRRETHADEHRVKGPNVTPITCFPKAQDWKCRVMEPECATASFKRRPASSDSHPISQVEPRKGVDRPVLNTTTRAGIGPSLRGSHHEMVGRMVGNGQEQCSVPSPSNRAQMTPHGAR